MGDHLDERFPTPRLDRSYTPRVLTGPRRRRRRPPRSAVVLGLGSAIVTFSLMIAGLWAAAGAIVAIEAGIVVGILITF